MFGVKVAVTPDGKTAYATVNYDALASEIDIADIDVGEQISARLRADQAEADTRVARAEAEQRRAEAIATEQVMKAKVAENRANLLLAEAEIPQAIGHAFLEGHFENAANRPIA